MKDKNYVCLDCVAKRKINIADIRVSTTKKGFCLYCNDTEAKLLAPVIDFIRGAKQINQHETHTQRAIQRAQRGTKEKNTTAFNKGKK